MTDVMKQTLETLPVKDNMENVYTTLMRNDKGFALAVQEAEEHWLSKANTVLAELLGEIKARITLPETSMGELVKALDTISNKWNVAMGKPTSFGVTANITKVDSGMKDEELDKRIREIERHMIVSPPHHQLPQEGLEEDNPLTSSESPGEILNEIEGELIDE